MLSCRCICKEDLPSRANAVFESPQNQIHSLLDAQFQKKKNTSRFMKHCLTAYNVQGIGPATGNYIFVLKSIYLPWSRCTVATWTLPGQNPFLDSRCRTRPQQSEGFSRHAQLLTGRGDLCLEDSSVSGAVLSVFSSPGRHFSHRSLPPRTERETGPWGSRRTYLKARSLLSILDSDRIAARFTVALFQFIQNFLAKWLNL